MRVTENEIKKLIRQSNLIESVDDPREDEQSFEAWCFINGVHVIDQSHLLELHHLITKNLMNKFSSGHYRTTNVQIGGKIAPAPYIAIGRTQGWLQTVKEHLRDDLFSPIDMHIEFEHIHPFIDGNGRTGRMLLWWQEMRRGEPLTEITFKDRDKYYQWFQES